MDDQQRIKRRPSQAGKVNPDETSVETVGLQVSAKEVVAMQKASHECPVPKPYGAIRKLLGVTKSDAAEVQPDDRKPTPNVEPQRRA